MNEAEKVRKLVIRQLQFVKMGREDDVQCWMGSSGDVEEVGVVRRWLKE